MAMAVFCFFSHAVQLTANWHGCSLLLLLLLILLPGLQPSPPAPQLHNTTSRCRKHRRACLINMEQLPKEEEGFGKHGTNGRLLYMRMCTGGSLPLSNEKRECWKGVVIFMMCITGRDKQARHSQWNQMASHYKGKHKEAPQPAAGLLEGRVGEPSGSMTPTEITPIYSYTTHHIPPHPSEAWVKNWKCENFFLTCKNSARQNFEKCLNKLFFHRNIVVWIRITYTKKVEQISVVFKSLYCLPVCQRI